MKIQKFLSDLEFILELEHLRKIGLSEEEIQGYFEFYASDWARDFKKEADDYVN